MICLRSKQYALKFGIEDPLRIAFDKVNSVNPDISRVSARSGRGGTVAYTLLNRC
jgi:hypothetical protein